MKHIDQEIERTFESLSGENASVRPAFYSRVTSRIQENETESVFSVNSFLVACSFLMLIGAGIFIGSNLQTINSADSDELELFVESYELTSQTSEYPEFE